MDPHHVFSAFHVLSHYMDYFVKLGQTLQSPALHQIEKGLPC